MPKKADKPVTHSELKVELARFKKEFKKELKQELKKDIALEFSVQTEALKRHFDVVAENIHRDVSGANRDEISLHADKLENHEERIQQLEARV